MGTSTILLAAEFGLLGYVRQILYVSGRLVNIGLNSFVGKDALYLAS